MGKKRAVWNEKTYLRYLKNGRGQGIGKNYIPWIQVQDFPSRGVCSRIYSEKCGRIHHLLSRMEEHFFYITINHPDVTDLREQFPLRLTETLSIADRLHIRHPWKGSFPFVMTTDFVISRGSVVEARTIKSSEDLKNKRICEKFSIEYEYWRSKGIDWKIVTEKEINVEKALNYRWLTEAVSVDSYITDNELRNLCETLFLRLYQDRTIPFTEICSLLERRYTLPSGCGLSIFRKLVLNDRIPLDLNMQINPIEPRCQEVMQQ